MQSKIVRIFCRQVLSNLALVNLCLVGVMSALAQPAPQPIAAQKTPDQVVWDALQKEASPKSGDTTADFIFTVTNVSDSEVIIDHAQGSCSCTVAKLPSQPWHLVPHTNGQINVSVNLAGKSGTLFKTVTVFYSNLPPTILRVTVHVPESPAMLRDRNQKAAQLDRQLVFKGDCAKCHADPAKDKSGKEVMGKALYAAVCGVCHEANPRATMVSDLHALNHPTNYEYWRQWIINGKPGTVMPAFAANQGGPLSDKQIVSLAKLLNKAFPSPISHTTLSTQPILAKPISSKTSAQP